jgi:hypothetical protein
MIDSFTKERIKVSDDGDAWPYIMVQLDQLELVKKLLDHSGIPNSVDEDAISFNDQAYSVIVNLEQNVDVAAVQKLLDGHEDPQTARHRRTKSARRG